MSNGYFNVKWPIVDPGTYEATDSEVELCDKLSALRQQEKDIRSQIHNLIHSCNHKVFREHDEDTGKDTWLGREGLEHRRCVICDGDFVGAYYIIG